MNQEQELPDAKLQESAQRLGARAAERLDVERTAQAVVTRLREQPERTTVWWVQPAWLRVAAAIVLFIGGGVLARSLLMQQRTQAVAVVPVGEDLSDLTADQLREAITALDQPVTEETAVVVDTGLEGLSAEELRALLRTLEG